MVVRCGVSWLYVCVCLRSRINHGNGAYCFQMLSRKRVESSKVSAGGTRLGHPVTPRVFFWPVRQVFGAVEDLVAELDRLHAQPHGKHAVRCVLEAMERVVMGEEGWFPPCLRMQVALALRARNPQLYGGGRGAVCVCVCACAHWCAVRSPRRPPNPQWHPSNLLIRATAVSPGLAEDDDFMAVFSAAFEILLRQGDVPFDLFRRFCEGAEVRPCRRDGLPPPLRARVCAADVATVDVRHQRGANIGAQSEPHQVPGCQIFPARCVRGHQVAP